MKKILSTFLALLMIITIIPMSTINAGANWGDLGDCTTETSGTCGENVLWEFDESTDTLTISGEGDMYDYDYYTQPWAHLNENIVNVIIEDGVTSIGQYSFTFFQNVKSLSIGNTVSAIDDCAFQGCFYLAEVNIPDSVNTIERYAFCGCAFEEVTISEYVTYIGNEAFGRGALKNITVSENNNNYASIDGVLFNKDKTSLIFFPPLHSESYTIPDGVLRIENSPFVESIITDITISEGVESIDEGAFGGTDYLERIDVVTENNCFSSIDGILFNKDITTILVYPCEKKDITVYAVPDTVTEIGGLAFNGCDFLKEIILPDNLKTIGSVAFYWCCQITQIQIPDTVTEIGDRTFDSCLRLTNVEFPDGVQVVGYGMFMHCESLESVVLPDSVNVIEDSVFYNCPNLKDVYYYGTQDNWDEIEHYDNSQYSDVTIHYNYEQGHYSEEIIKAPTCTEDGEIKYTCLCNIERIDIAPATGHDFNNEYICLNCGYSRMADVNCDGVVSSDDYEVVLEVICRLNDEYFWADVNSDGDETPLDARLISHYLADKETNLNTIPQYTDSECKDISIFFDKRVLEAGEKLILTIDIPENSGLATAEFVYQIESSKYTVTKIEKGDLFEHELVSSLSFGDETDGVYQVRYAGFSDEAITNGGNLLTIELEANVDMPDASDADYYIEFNGTDNDYNYSNTYDDIKWGQSPVNCVHPETNIITIPATCTVAGMTYTVCEACGETIGDSTVISATGHTAGEWEVVLEPTYEADGKQIKKCTVCGETVEEETIPMLVKNVVTDEDTGVSMEFDNTDYDGVVDIVVEKSFDGAAFDVIDTSLNASQKFIYDITMTVDGEAVQPTGTVTVRIPLPEGYDPNRSFVYHVDTETGTVEKMSATYEDGYLVFETTHFSYYAVVEDASYTFSIQTPSRTTIRHNDGIVLHANAENLPEGAYIRWTADNKNFKYTASDDGMSLTAISANNGDTTFYAIVYNADGEIIESDSVTLTSNAGFFQKFAGFFRSLFGSTKLYEY